MKVLLTAAAAMPLAFAAPCLAQTLHEIRIGMEEGAIYDGIVDGFPGIATLDGVADLPGNALGVALRSGVTEERGVAEFPTESIPHAFDLVEATLTFNVDDVLSTFGPGTDFSGRAADSILVHVYAGDGELSLADFAEVGREAHVVDTTVVGTITDATLSKSGPIVFEVDVTDDIAAVLSAEATHFGIVFRVDDSPTGTSLDDLGDGSTGPPGVGGAAFPFLTLRLREIVGPTATPVPPTPTPIVPNACAGDCSEDGQVTVDEVVRLVAVALGNEIPSTCPAGDADGDGQVTVDEIVNAIGMALGGCSDANA